MSATEHLNSLNVWELARLADCGEPYSNGCPGAEFLSNIRNSVVANWDRLVDPHYENVADEIVDNNVPSINDLHTIWNVSMDLAAYRESIGWFGRVDNLTLGARVAIYQIAQRLVNALVDEGRRLNRD